MQTSNLTANNSWLFLLLNNFFEQHELRECRKQVWDLTTAYFSQPDDVQLTRQTRSNIVYFCAKLDELFNGLHFVWDHWKQSTASIEYSNGID